MDIFYIVAEYYMQNKDDEIRGLHRIVHQIFVQHLFANSLTFLMVNLTRLVNPYSNAVVTLRSCKTVP